MSKNNATLKAADEKQNKEKNVKQREPSEF